jgi:hypothetical protein
MQRCARYMARRKPGWRRWGSMPPNAASCVICCPSRSRPEAVEGL